MTFQNQTSNKADIGLLEIIAKVLLTDNKSIRRTQVINIDRYISNLNPTSYENNPVSDRLVYIIKKAVEARLEHNLADPKVIISHINGGPANDNIIDPDSFSMEATQAEVDWLNESMAASAKFTVIERLVDDLLSKCTQFKTGDYISKSEITVDLESSVSELQNEFRRCRNEDHTEMAFSLQNDVFEDCIRNTYDVVANPKRKLTTGCQGLNLLLGGGFEAGRVYTFFGLPGEGKSTLLLNILLQLRKYNKGFACKDPTKKPCVVLLTMENAVTESIERLFSIISNNKRITDYSVNEVINILRNRGDFTLRDGNDIDIRIIYKASNSVDTSYLYTITEDLEDEGYEVIAFLQDYIGRIRAVNKNKEVRLEYSNIVDEFKVYSVIKEVPVITASQLNRDASKTVDDGRNNNKSDLVRLIGRSNIAESINILNNVDGAFMLAPEYTREGEKYMGIQCIKHRYGKEDNTTFVYLPFIKDGIGLEEDVGLQANFKNTLNTETQCLYGANAVENAYGLNRSKTAEEMMIQNETNISNGVASGFIGGSRGSYGQLDDMAAPFNFNKIKHYHQGALQPFYPIVFQKPVEEEVNGFCPIVFFNKPE